MRWPNVSLQATTLTRRICLGLICLSLVGCGVRAKDLPLDSKAAEEALAAFLETWKSGGQKAELEVRRPGLVAGDYDWESGAKLIGYTIQQPGFSDGTNWHVEVELELTTSDGKTRKSTIPYVVGTSPVETIFRK